MLKKIMRKDLFELFHLTKKFIDSKTETDFKIMYVILKNRDVILKEIKLIEELTSTSFSSELYVKEYVPKIRKINEKYALRDENGNIIENNGRFFPNDIENHKNEIEQMNKEYSECIAAQKEFDEKYKVFINEEIEIELFEITKENEDLIPKTEPIFSVLFFTYIS